VQNFTSQKKEADADFVEKNRKNPVNKNQGKGGHKDVRIL
jgi:hypothetical protein